MTDTVDLLVIGGSGFVGACAAQAAGRLGRAAACTHLSRPVPPGVPAYRLDLDDAAALRRVLEETQPGALLYCALSWDLASEAAQMHVSLDGLRAVLRALGEVGLTSRLVYVSTNAVFSGASPNNSEHDLPDSHARQDAYRNYGLARRAGELAALEEWGDTIVTRTANVDGRDAWGQLNPRILSLIDPLRAGQPLVRFVDRFISPTLVANLAGALVEVAHPGFPLPPGRVLHLSGREPVSDYDYARRIAARLGADPGLVRGDHVERLGARMAPGRYNNIGLDVTFSQSLLKTRLLSVDEMLAELL